MGLGSQPRGTRPASRSAKDDLIIPVEKPALIAKTQAR